MKSFIAHCAIIGFFAAIFIGPLYLSSLWDHDKKVNDYHKLTNGCHIVGTIQGYNVGRGNMPAQEQWSCNGMMRTINSVN